MRLIKHIQNHLFAQLVTDDKFKVGTFFGMILPAFHLSGQRAKAVMRYLHEKSEIFAIELRLYNVLDGIHVDIPVNLTPLFRSKLTPYFDVLILG